MDGTEIADRVVGAFEGGMESGISEEPAYAMRTL